MKNHELDPIPELGYTDKKYTWPLSVIISLFFMWGLLTVLNDILVPHLKQLFQLDYVEAMLIQFCFFAAYGLISLPSGKIVSSLGYKKGILIALCTASLGCLIFVPAAYFSLYPVFLAALFVLASGIVLLQVAANPYVALLGKEKTASSRLNLAQAFNSLGTTIGPQIGSVIILSVVAASSKSAAQGIEILYAALAGIFLLVFLLIALTKLPKILGTSYDIFQKNLSRQAAIRENVEIVKYKTKTRRIWEFPHLYLGALAIFFYVGAEVSIGSFLVNFLSDPNVLGLSKLSAGQHVSLYWGGAMIGRFVGFAVLLKIKARKVLIFNSIIALILVALTFFGSGPFVGYTALSIGLFNSVMFPTIFTLAIAGLEEFTPEGSGILCAAIVGGAILPVVQGYCADRIGIQHAFFIPFICYAYILYYAYRGSLAYCRVRNIRKREKPE